MGLPMRWDYAVAPEPSDAPLRRRRARRKRHPVRLLFALALCAVAAGTAVVGAKTLLHVMQPAPALRLLKNERAGASVALASASVERSVGFATVTGNVINHTNQPISNVEAVVELLDAQNKTIRVESALVPFDPLPVGVTAPFRVELTDDSRAASYRVSFKRLLGSSLN
jgi:hypothetical protein